MTYLIKKWYLPAEEDEFIKDYTFEMHNGRGQDWLENLSKVNIFVGPNNSGKSRFMRYLYKRHPIRFSPNDIDLEYLLSLIGIIKEKIIIKFREKFSIEGADKIFRDLYHPNMVPRNYAESDAINPIKLSSFLERLNSFIKGKEPIYSEKHDLLPMQSYSTFVAKEIIEDAEELESINEQLGKQYNFNRIYIPVLRGLRPFTDSQDNYLNRTVHDYSLPSNQSNFEIFTGLKMFESIRDLLTGDLKERELKEEYENFLSEYFFEKKTIELIPRKDSDVIFIKIGNEDEFPIYELGDGIQQLIIMTYPPFLQKGKDVLLFIEEPELYLHPGLQRILVNLLTSDVFGSNQTFLTTHSNHFLDLTMDYRDISVFKVTKEIEDENADLARVSFIVENTINKDRNTLELIGVKNSSVLLTNCTVWVEGITDRLYIRKYLEVYQNDLDSNDDKFDEDRHYSFVEYSGNNITHWSFLDDSEESIEVAALCGTLFLVADQDEQKEERHMKLKKVLCSRYYPLNCREIENLLIPRVLEETIRDFPKVIFKKKPKILDADYNTAKLGEYIDKNILQGNSGKKFKSKYGSINCKMDFAKKAINHINSIDDMSKEALELTEKIYNFIKEQNK